MLRCVTLISSRYVRILIQQTYPFIGPEHTQNLLIYKALRDSPSTDGLKQGGAKQAVVASGHRLVKPGERVPLDGVVLEGARHDAAGPRVLKAGKYISCRVRSSTIE